MSELTAAHSTIEKAREVTNCPDGVDLQDHLKQLVSRCDALTAENAELKEIRKNLAEFIHDELDADYPLNMRIETPATDSILREAEARGVEKFGEHVKAYNYSAGWQSKHFAEQLREGKA
ncbi:TPA: hypothetical protein ACP4PI_000299 [Escherichia coli]